MSMDLEVFGPALLVVTPGGRSPQNWQRVVDGAAPVTIGDLLSGVGSGHPLLLVVSAHPDDETIGAGSLLAGWQRAGFRSGAVLATAGEACLDHLAVRPPDLAARRLAEWDAALDELGVGERYLLGLPDGQLDSHEEALADTVSSLIERLSADHAVLLVAPHPDDPHPDHQAAGRAALRAGQAQSVPVIGYPVWMPYWSDPDTAPACRRLFTDPADQARRAAALSCFPTQFEPMGPGLTPVVPAELLDHHTTQLLFPLAGGLA